MLENKGITEIKKLCGRHGLSTIQLSNYLDVLPLRFYEILHGKRRITADTDLRLTKFFELQKGYFLNLQTQYDLEISQIQMEEKLAKIQTIYEVVRPKKASDESRI